MNFRIGEIVILEIIEPLPEGRFIVSVNGRLIRTKPILDHKPSPNDRLKARVISVNPLGFQVLNGQKIGLDREI